MQSRRVRLPIVEPIADFETVAGRPGAALAAPDGDPPGPAHRVLLIGPEGGWSAAERARPLSRVGLGETVLRAETAAIAAGILLVDRHRSSVG